MNEFSMSSLDAPALLDALGAVRAPGSSAVTTATSAHAVWGALVEPGDSVAWRLIASLGPVEALEQVVRGESDRADAAGLTREELAGGIKRWRPRLTADAATTPVHSARRSGVRMLIPGDAHWPTAVDDLGPHAPVCLWVRGDPGTLGIAAPSVAIVGARAASSYGDHVAMEFAGELAGRGITVVSGAAYGIDGSAHRAALAAGGTTIALLAGGADRAYPAGHANLLERIARDGAIVSEVPCGGAPTKWRFLQRNRLIAALGDATVVVEAGWRSGSLNTAGHAATLGRPLGAVPGPVTSPASAGCHRLLREYDARCVTSADDIVELLGFPDPAGSAARGRGRSHDETRVADALSRRVGRSTAEIARSAGLGPDEAEAVLGLMSLTGAAVLAGDGWRSGES